jgi:hypothetical protein
MSEDEDEIESYRMIWEQLGHFVTLMESLSSAAED